MSGWLAALVTSQRRKANRREVCCALLQGKKPQGASGPVMGTRWLNLHSSLFPVSVSVFLQRERERERERERVYGEECWEKLYMIGGVFVCLFVYMCVCVWW